MRESILILGGGVIGLSCAFELRRRGHAVTVLEKGRCGGQASGAAAGMLAPYSENAESPDDFFRLCRDSLRLYPDWQRAVRRISGLSFEYAESGSLYAIYHEADRLALEGRLLWQREHGSTGLIMEGKELFELEPMLSREVRAALYTPQESHVYAPDYVGALEKACRELGVTIRDQLGSAEVISWASEIAVKAQAKKTVPDRGDWNEAEGDVAKSRVANVHETAREANCWQADRLLICNGAWALELADVFGISIPVYPIRGQICAYEAEELPVRHMVFGNQGYLVGKANGTLVCGASEDVAGFDASVTERGIERLRQWNKRLFPFLEERKPFHRWAGLRPSTLDGLPLIGPLRASNGRVQFATGHYRNGILLSPATAMLAADWIEERPIKAGANAFLPDRFA